MRSATLLQAAAAFLVFGAGALAAETKIYPYHATENFCPAGLQPVTMDGTICCGKPNQSMSYQAVMRHGTQKRHVRQMSEPKEECPLGTKGCS